MSWNGCGALSLCPFLGAAHTTGVTELWCPQHSLEWVMLVGWVGVEQLEPGCWVPTGGLGIPKLHDQPLYCF